MFCGLSAGEESGLKVGQLEARARECSLSVSYIETKEETTVAWCPVELDTRFSLAYLNRNIMAATISGPGFHDWQRS